MPTKSNFIAILLLLTLTSPARPAEPSDKKDQDGALLETIPFTDPKSGISARLPKGWIAKQGIKNTGYQTPEKDRTDEGGLAPNIIFNKTETPRIKAADLPKLIAQKRKQYPQLFPSYQETINQPIDINGKPGHVLGCTYMADKVLPIQVKQIWVVTDGNIYIVTCTSLKATYEKNEKTFDAVIKTVVIP